MIVAAVIILVVALTIGGIILQEEADYWDRENLGCLTLVLSFLICLGVVFGAIALNRNNCDIIEEEIVEIYSGGNDYRIKGSFFLLGGSVEEKDVVFYWINENGVKSKHHLPMDKSIFIEDGGEYVIIKEKVCREGWKWFFISKGFYEAEFHVPKNSIIKMYQYQ